MPKPTPKRSHKKQPKRAAPRQRVTPAPAPTPLDEETATIQQEQHGALEEAMEPPPRRTGDDIQRA